MFYSTQPAVMSYFLKGMKGCCSFVGDAQEDYPYPIDIDSLKNKELHIFSNMTGSNDMVYTNARCYMSQFMPVFSEEVIEDIQYSDGRVFVQSLSNENVIKNPVEETTTYPNNGYYLFDTSNMLFSGDTPTTFKVKEYKLPSYIMYDIVKYNNEYYIYWSDSTVTSESVPGTNADIWKLSSTSVTSSIPTYNTDITYSQFAIVKSGDSYYVSIVDSNSNKLLTNTDYWAPANLADDWCYPTGSYVFYGNALFVCNPTTAGITNAGFNTPSEESAIWKQVNGIKVVSKLIEYDDREWKPMISSDNSITLTEEQKSTFTEYSFSPDDGDILSEFNYFVVRMDLQSKDEINVPRVKNLRAIALV